MNLLFRKTFLACFVCMGMLSFYSCSSDDDLTNGGDGGTTIPSENNPYLVSLAISGSDGTFTYYSVPVGNLMEGTLTAEGVGIEQPGYYDFLQIENTVYSVGGLDDVNVVAIAQNEDNEVYEAGNVSFDESLSDIVEADANTLVSVSMSSSSDVVVFRTFDKNSVNATANKTIPVSDFVDAEVAGPSYSGMVIRGDHLFLSYYLSDPDSFETNYTDEAAIAVFSYPSLEFEKVITDDRVGPIGGFNLKTGLIEDEQGTIYAVSHSNPANGYSQSTKPAGILKINAGETEFDEEYFLNIGALTEGKTAVHLNYLKNGNAFAEINQQDRENQERWSDAPLKPAIINLENQTIDYIEGIPEHAGGGRRLPLLVEGDNFYLAAASDEGIYVYKVNSTDFTVTRGAAIEANFVAGLFKFE